MKIMGLSTPSGVAVQIKNKYFNPKRVLQHFIISEEKDTVKQTVVWTVKAEKRKWTGNRNKKDQLN